MKIDTDYRSRNVEDRRGRGGRGGGGMGTGLKLGGGVSLPILLLVVLFTVCSGGEGGVDLGSVLNELDQGGGSGGSTTGGGTGLPETTTTDNSGGAADARYSEEFALVNQVLDDSQETWAGIFEQSGLDYPVSTLVVYEGGTSTAGCGYGQAAYGPFYCPADSRTYVDLAFFDQLQQQFGAGGDFAQAYVIAHEIGHHVQNALGLSAQVRQAQQSDPANANDLSVRLELQADCFAGIWANDEERDGDLRIDDQDIQEAVEAAAAIGDDNIQRQSGRNPNPESFTHGSSAQRVEWFRRGFQSGDPNDCDTFA
jgi:predicted metalloprotease